MTTEELKNHLLPFFDDNENLNITILSQERREKDKATIVKFDSEGRTLFAIIYDDGTCFTPYDWDQPEIETVEDVEKWIDTRFVEGIVLNGLPRFAI